MLNRFESVKKISSCVSSLCTGFFCIEINNAMHLGSAIALSVFVYQMVVAMIFANTRNPLNRFLAALNPVPIGQMKFIERFQQFSEGSLFS